MGVIELTDRTIRDKIKEVFFMQFQLDAPEEAVNEIHEELSSKNKIEEKDIEKKVYEAMQESIDFYYT